MNEIFIDIENTLIDDLSSMKLLDENIKRISSLCHIEIWNRNNTRINLFTWGWKEHSEIKQYVVDWLFDALDIPPEHRGVVWTKDDSINCAFEHKWINTKDEVAIEDLHIPGAMRRWGLEKQTCFIQQCMDKASFPNNMQNFDTFMLIDDTNPRWFENRTFFKNGTVLNVIFHNPAEMEIREEAKGS